MRITYITLKFDQTGGGSNKSLELLAERLTEDHDVEIITLRKDLNDILSAPVPIQQRSCVSWSDTFRECLRVLKDYQSQTDLYHIFSPILIPIGGAYRKQGGTTPVVGRLNTYNLFCTNPSRIKNQCYQRCSIFDKILHDNDSTLTKLGNVPKYLYNHSSLWLCSYVDRLFAISPSVEEIYADAGVEAPITMIPNFYDPEFYTSSSGETNAEPKTVLFVGRLVAEKGVDTLINAFERLQREDVKLLIIGDGPRRQKLIELAQRLSVRGRIEFKGWVSYEELPGYYAGSSLFVHPGLWPEPFGRTILEAMQHQVPLVVSDVGAPPWVAGDSALTFEPGSISDLTSCLHRGLDTRTDTTFRRDYHQRLERFAPDTVIKTIKQQYEVVLG